MYSFGLLFLHFVVSLPKTLSDLQAFESCGTDSAGKLLENTVAVHLLGCARNCLKTEAQTLGCKALSFNSKKGACKMMLSLNNCSADDDIQQWQTFKLTSCVDGWVFWHGSCYKIYTENVNWTVARSNCGNVGAHLTALETTEESHFVWTGVSQKYPGNVFIGGRDLEVEGEWRWEDGDDDTLNDNLVPFGDDWRSGNPDNMFGNENCMMLEMEGTWNDAQCDLEFPYICEYHL